MDNGIAQRRATERVVESHRVAATGLPHCAAPESLTRELRTDLAVGLDGAKARARLTAFGANELRKSEPVRPLAIFATQFKSLVVWILIGAAVVSAALGEAVDGIAIIAIVFLNSLFGFYQEFRAEKAAAALAQLLSPRARVLRGGRSEIVPAAEIVHGDVLLLDTGDLVAADARLFEAHQLQMNEAPLTGESLPVAKAPGTCPEETPLAERANMVFLRTSVAAGAARAAVVATGMQTEIGRIADLLSTAGAGETPLQRRLDRVGGHHLWACLGIVVLVFLLGLLRSIPPFELFLGSVSLAVAAMPEGLPAVVTVALALGMQRMARRHALIKHLPAVETLGSAQVICTDRTGTLNVGEMTARRAVTPTSSYRVTAEGYSLRARSYPMRRGKVRSTSARNSCSGSSSRSIPRLPGNTTGRSRPGCAALGTSMVARDSRVPGALKAFMCLGSKRLASTRSFGAL